MLTALATGLLATVLAIAQAIALVATGLLFVPGDVEDELAMPSAIVIGVGITAFVFAIGTYLGLTDALLVGVAIAWIAAVLWRWRALGSRMRGLGAVLRPLFKRRLVAVAMIVVTVVLWVDAIVPPRDADVMCYHLAHVRQILLDHRWVPLSDYYYALPFGWTLTFLPFERLGVPEAAHVLTLILWLITVSVMAAWLLRQTGSTDGVAVVAVVALQPGLVKMVTTAHADGYAMLVTLVVALLVVRGPALRPKEATLLGFAAWIGVQSRSQLAAVGIVATVFFLVETARGGISRHIFVAGLGGAIAALLLSAPFYAVNAIAFGNPVWPMLIPQINGLVGYSDRMANAFNQRIVGTRSLSALPETLSGLFRDPLVFPLPVLAALLVSATAWARTTTTRRLALFALAFFGVWYAAQPSMYPRFVLLLVPMIVLGLGVEWHALLERLGGIRGARATAVGCVALGCTGFAAVDVWYAKDAAVYVTSGDLDRYHAATWYYPVYRYLNDSTPATARFMVIVRPPEQTYYLNRWYRRADPETTGLVDWQRVTSANALMQELQKLGIDHVLYEPGEWARNGGPAMKDAITRAVAEGRLRLVKTFDVNLVTRRLTGEAIQSSLWLLLPSS